MTCCKVYSLYALQVGLVSSLGAGGALKAAFANECVAAW